MKRLALVLALAALLFPYDGQAGKGRPVGFSWFMGSTDSGIQVTAQTRFYAINGPESSDAGTTEALRQWPMGVAGRVSRMHVWLNGDVGAAGSNLAVTVRKNGADTALTCTITGSTGTEAVCADAAHEVVFAPADLVAVQFVTTGTPNAALPRWRIRFDPDVAGDFPISSLLTIALLSNLDRYQSVNAGGSQTTIPLAEMVMPVSGTVRALYSQASAVVAAGTRTVDVLRNGVVSTEFQCINTAGAQQCTDLTGSLRFLAGDKITFHTVSGDAATLTGQGITIRFSPDNPGEFPIFSSVASPTTGAISYTAIPGGSGSATNATEATVQSYFPALTILRLYATSQVAPGAGASWLVGMSKTGQRSTLQCQMADPSVACTSPEMQSTEADDLVTTIATPSTVAPAASRLSFSLGVRPR